MRVQPTATPKQNNDAVVKASYFSTRCRLKQFLRSITNMSWRLAFHSTKLLFSYLFPYKMKGFRDAIFDGDVAAIRQYAAERPRLLQQSIDADGNTALGN